MTTTYLPEDPALDLDDFPETMEQLLHLLSLDTFLERGGDLMKVPDIEKYADIAACAKMTPHDWRESAARTFYDELVWHLTGQDDAFDSLPVAEGWRQVRHFMWLTNIFAGGQEVGGPNPLGPTG